MTAAELTYETLTDTTGPANSPVPSEQQRQTDLARRAAKFSADIDSGRWALAALGYEAKERKVRDWAAIISISCRRAARTVRAWVVTYEWTQSAGAMKLITELPYSFFEQAARYADRVNERELLHLLGTYRAEQGASLESFMAELGDLAGQPEPDAAKQWTRMSTKLYGQVDAELPDVGEQLAVAAKALSKAVELKVKAANKPIDAAEVFKDVAAQINAGAMGPNVTASVSRGGLL